MARKTKSQEDAVVAIDPTLNPPEGRSPKALSLKEAAAYLGITDQRMRVVLRNGRVSAFKNDDGHWRVLATQLDEYNASKGRKQGRKQFVVHLDETNHEVEALAAWFKEQGIESTIEPRYRYDPAKAKAYREKKAAEQSAETGTEDESES